ARDRRVPRQSPLSAIERELRVEADALTGARVRRDAEVLDAHGDRLRRAADREVTVDRVLALRLRRDLRALEDDLRVVVGVEEVGGTQVGVALLVMGVDVLRRDAELDAAGLRARRIELDDAGGAAESAANG